MNHTTFASILATSAFAALSAIHASAAPVTWSPPSNITTSDTDVITSGTLDYAYNFGASDSGTLESPTVNGVTFQAFGTPLSGGSGTTNSVTIGSVTLSASSGNIVGYNAYGNPSGTSSDYTSLLQTGIYTSTEGATLTLNLNDLQVGDQYSVQLWVNDSRDAGDVYNRELTVTGGGNTSSAVAYNTNPSSPAGALGQYVVGTFTADSTTETLSLASAGSASQYPQINAIDVSTIGSSPSVPEPSSYSLIISGVVSLVLVMRLRRREGFSK